MCDDLDINKTIGCAQFLKLNDKIIGGNRMIV